jgi:hypothetical protein
VTFSDDTVTVALLDNNDASVVRNVTTVHLGPGEQTTFDAFRCLPLYVQGSVPHQPRLGVGAPAAPQGLHVCVWGRPSWGGEAGRVEVRRAPRATCRWGYVPDCVKSVCVCAPPRPRPASGTYCVFITTIPAAQQSFVYNVTVASGQIAARVPLNGSAWNMHMYLNSGA